MLTLDDLTETGLQPVAAAAAISGGPLPIPDGSPLARALAQVWSGAAIVTVKAPPGSGKTHTVLTLMTHLVSRAGLRVAIGCPTRAQAASLTNRLVDVMPAGTVELVMTGKNSEPNISEAAVKARLPHTATSGVSVHTLASCARVRIECDVFVVDEAYQATFSSVQTAARAAPQILLVGDPGQIGPVVTTNTSMFERLTQAPHRRSPEVFDKVDGAVKLHLDCTYRLGPVTTAAIAPLYSFPFHSARPNRHVRTAGTIQGEIEPLPLGTVDDLDDPTMLAALVNRAQALVRGTHVDEHGTTRPMTASDVAVVVSRNSQISVLEGMLSSRGLSGVTLGTADKLQGGEWSAVVALDPLVGAESASDYAVSLGRLCVMASRHRTHLTWAFADNWRSLLNDATDLSPKDRSISVTVRDALTSTCKG